MYVQPPLLWTTVSPFYFSASMHVEPWGWVAHYEVPAVPAQIELQVHARIPPLHDMGKALRSAGLLVSS
jgi:hypothetical protein